ncbi:MAG TPA: sec-independent translocase [Nocardioidaceae bacterium]|nr:sec-independent translocase [Nocardioidaceae bacterium]
MFGVGLPEFLVIFVVAILVFGPDRLPEFARQAGRFVRQVRTFTQAARDDLRSELGPEFADLELTDLDPRQIVRKHILEAMDDEQDVSPTVPVRPGLRPLERGEHPPYDAEAT